MISADDLRYSFWVCEKSDGVRVLVMIVCVPGQAQEVYLVRALDLFTPGRRLTLHRVTTSRSTGRRISMDKQACIFHTRTEMILCIRTSYLMGS